MSLQRSCCCAGPDPDPLICCTCPASSYSIALDIGWTSVCYDPSGNFGTVGASFSYSGWTVVAGTCIVRTTTPPGQHNLLPFDPTSSSGQITNASVSLGFSNAVTCSNQSTTGESLITTNILDCQSGSVGFAAASALECHHYRKSDDSVVYRWFHKTTFQTATFCPFGGPREFMGCVSAMSPEQATCHAPPSSGWTDVQSRIHYCYDTSLGLCAPGRYSAASSTNKTFSLTIT